MSENREQPRIEILNTFKSFLVAFPFSFSFFAPRRAARAPVGAMLKALYSPIYFTKPAAEPVDVLGKRLAQYGPVRVGNGDAEWMSSLDGSEALVADIHVGLLQCATDHEATPTCARHADVGLTRCTGHDKLVSPLAFKLISCIERRDRNLTERLRDAIGENTGDGAVGLDAHARKVTCGRPVLTHERHRRRRSELGQATKTGATTRSRITEVERHALVLRGTEWVEGQGIARVERT